MRDPDGCTYFKEEVGGLVVGGFEPEAKPWRVAGRDPVPVRVPAARRGLGALLGADGRGAARGSRRWPRPGSASSTTGPRVFTPDNQFLLGRGARSCAASSSAPASTRSASPRPAAPGGRWPSGSSTGEPTMRPGRRSTSAGSRRSTPTTRWLRDRVAEVLGLHYAVPWPNRELETGRDRRGCSPLHDRLAAAGAVLRHPDGLGAAERLRARAGAGARLRLGQAVLAAVVAPPSSARRRDGGRGLRPDVVLQVRRRRARRARRRCSGSAPADVDVPVGRLRLHAVAQRARHLRGRPDRHPRPAPTRFLLVSQLGDHGARPRLAPPAPGRGCRRRGRRRAPTTLRRARA